MQPVEENKKRSTFVTVLAWVFIVIAGWGTFIGIAQNIMLHTFIIDKVEEVRQNNESGQIFSESQNFMMDYGEYIFLAVPILSGILLAVAIGLLKRKNWARKLFIGFMGLSICWFIFSHFLVPEPFGDMEMAPDNFAKAYKMMQVITIIMSVLFVALFGWIIKKLVSSGIRQEFVNE